MATDTYTMKCRNLNTCSSVAVGFPEVVDEATFLMWYYHRCLVAVEVAVVVVVVAAAAVVVAKQHAG